MPINTMIFRIKLLWFIIVLYLLYNIVKQDEFKDMMLYTSPTLKGNKNRTLLRSHNTVKAWLLVLFLVS